jgi:hypothetical protein
MSKRHYSLRIVEPMAFFGDGRHDLVDQAAALAAFDRQHRPARIGALGNHPRRYRCLIHPPLRVSRRLQLYRLCYRYGWTFLPVVYLLPVLSCCLLLIMILPIGKFLAEKCQGEPYERIQTSIDVLVLDAFYQ